MSLLGRIKALEDRVEGRVERPKACNPFLTVDDEIYFSCEVWRRGLYFDLVAQEKLLLEWMPHKTEAVREYFAKVVTAKDPAWRERWYGVIKGVEDEMGWCEEDETYEPVGFPGLTGREDPKGHVDYYPDVPVYSEDD